MELLVLGWRIGGDGTWGFVNVARSVMRQECGAAQRIRLGGIDVEVDDTRPYRSAGSNQVRLSVTSLDDLIGLLEQPTVREAASLLALRVMRSRATIYSKFHCPNLADHALGESGSI